MATTLTAGDATITPDLVLGYRASVTSGNVVHRHLDRTVSVSIGEDDPRSGTLELLFATRADAWAAIELLRGAAVWTLTSELGELDMTFVRVGTMEIELDPDTRVPWVIRVEYQEVSA